MKFKIGRYDTEKYEETLGDLHAALANFYKTTVFFGGSRVDLKKLHEINTLSAQIQDLVEELESMTGELDRAYGKWTW